MDQAVPSEALVEVGLVEVDPLGVIQNVVSAILEIQAGMQPVILEGPVTGATPQHRRVRRAVVGLHERRERLMMRSTSNLSS